MKRVLFVVPPLMGHINPTLGVAEALQRRGVEVAWVGHRSVLAARVGAHRVFALPEVDESAELKALFERAQAARGLEIVRSRFEDIFFPLARSMLPGVEDAIRAYAPDVTVVDHQAFGGAMAARRLGVRWATLATTTVPLLDPFGPLPKIKEWLDAQFQALEAEVGLPASPTPDLSPDLVIVSSVPELAGPLSPCGPEMAWCGSIVGGRTAERSFPWERLVPGRPRVLVSLGTVNMAFGGPFFAAVRDAARALKDRVQLVVVGNADIVGELPAPHLRVDWAPQLELLPEMAAVLCHGGHNTVVESLAAGRPVVVAPMKDDQPMVAQQVVLAGVGLRIHAGRRATGPAIVGAIEQVLGDAALRERVDGLRAALARAGGAEAAAERLASLAAGQAREP